LIVLTHAKTVSAHNLKPGFSEAWERDRVAIEALRERDQFGEYSPKGEYLVTIPGEGPEVWRWPEWMVVNLDPVGWVLDAFPEFKGKAIEGGDRSQDRPLAPSTPAPKWASEAREPARVFGFDVGSNGGSNGGSMPERGSTAPAESNRAEPRNEPLELPDSREFMEPDDPVRGSTNHHSNREPSQNGPKQGPLFTKRNLTREQTIATIEDLLEAGMSKTKIIERLWDCTKGGGATYSAALAQYNNLMEEMPLK
jgi:hypothetical protein